MKRRRKGGTLKGRRYSQSDEEKNRLIFPLKRPLGQHHDNMRFHPDPACEVPPVLSASPPPDYECLAVYSLGASFGRDRTPNFVGHGHFFVVSPDTMSVLKRQFQKRSDFLLWKAKEKKKPSFPEHLGPDYHLNSSGKITVSAADRHASVVALALWSITGKPKGLHVHQLPSHPNTWEDYAENHTQLSWCFPSLYRESLPSAVFSDSSSILIGMRTTNAPRGQEYPVLFHPLPLSLPEAQPQPFPKTLPQFQPLHLTQIRPRVHLQSPFPILPSAPIPQNHPQLFWCFQFLYSESLPSAVHVLSEYSSIFIFLRTSNVSRGQDYPALFHPLPLSLPEAQPQPFPQTLPQSQPPPLTLIRPWVHLQSPLPILPSGPVPQMRSCGVHLHRLQSVSGCLSSCEIQHLECKGEEGKDKRKSRLPGTVHGARHAIKPTSTLSAKSHTEIKKRSLLPSVGGDSCLNTSQEISLIVSREIIRVEMLNGLPFRVSDIQKYSKLGTTESITMNEDRTVPTETPPAKIAVLQDLGASQGAHAHWEHNGGCMAQGQRPRVPKRRFLFSRFFQQSRKRVSPQGPTLEALPGGDPGLGTSQPKMNSIATEDTEDMSSEGMMESKSSQRHFRKKIICCFPCFNFGRKQHIAP